MYRKLIRPVLFLLSAETSHRLTLGFLRLLYLVPGMHYLIRTVANHVTPSLPTKVMGLEFPNPVGMAAGMDKNAKCARPLADLGFGWVELGTVTPLKQSGNPGKCIFRLPDNAAIINRMGFTSVGVDRFIRNLQRFGKGGIAGINIGKNRNTPMDQAIDDYLSAMQAVYPYADYITVNISSPNTSHLRDLQKRDNLDALLGSLKNEQIMLGKTRRHYVPLAVKIAPDLNDEEIATIAEMLIKHKIDAVIATNTTITRPGIEDDIRASERGGLSGRPLKTLSTEVIRKLYNHLQGQIPIIGVGGVENAADAWDKMVAGADLIQIYTGFIYEGPAIIRRIVRGLERRVRSSGFSTISEAVSKARSGIHLMR